MIKSNSNEKFIILILMITIIIDIMGLGLIFPIIPELTLDKANTLFLDVNTSTFVRYSFYGLIMAVWPLGLFIGSSIIGRLSDIYGRKKLLIISLVGIASSYMLSVFAIYISNIYIFILSRLSIGLFGGCFGLAQTIIIDISPKEKLTTNLSFVTLACSIGLILGPSVTTLMGKIYQDSSFMAVVLPCFIGGIISIANLISVCMFLKETNNNSSASKLPNFFDMIFSFRKMFLDNRLITLAMSFLLMQMAWGFYIQSFPLIMSSKFDLNQAQIGISFILAAFGYLVAILGILPKLEKHCSLKSIVVVNALLLSVFLISNSIWPSLFMSFLVFTIASVFQLLFYSAILTWISSKVDDHEQGQVMGGTVSIFGIAWAINALLISSLVYIQIFLPVYVAAALFLISGILVIKVIEDKNK